jgi:hypothetical protein
LTLSVTSSVAAAVSATAAGASLTGVTLIVNVELAVSEPSVMV